jgi:hypothetical protein
LEVDVQQGNFKILWLLPQVLILFVVEKWIPPSRSEIAEIGPKNRRNFRGYSTLVVKYILAKFHIHWASVTFKNIYIN